MRCARRKQPRTLACAFSRSALGRRAGSLIPIQGESGGTAFVKDAQGQVVKSKLDETRLREVAQAAGGFYVHLENGPRTMKQLFSDGLAKMQVADINARLVAPADRALRMAACGRDSVLRARALDQRSQRSADGPAAAGNRSARLLPPQPLLFVTAGGWARAASPGLQLYEQQKFPEAYEHFQKTLQENPGARPTDRIQFDAGAAAYKMKDYNKALQSFSQALLSKDPHLQSESHYNLGNTLYERGEAEKSDAKKLTNWEGALPHYEETLKAEPQNKNAKDNYEYVKKKIEELKKKQEQKPSPTPSPSPHLRLRLRRKRTRRTIKSRTTRISNKTKTSRRRTNNKRISNNNRRMARVLEKAKSRKITSNLRRPPPHQRGHRPRRQRRVQAQALPRARTEPENRLRRPPNPPLRRVNNRARRPRPATKDLPRPRRAPPIRMAAKTANSPARLQPALRTSR